MINFNDYLKEFLEFDFVKKIIKYILDYVIKLRRLPRQFSKSISP